MIKKSILFILKITGIYEQTKTIEYLKGDKHILISVRRHKNLWTLVDYETWNVDTKKEIFPTNETGLLVDEVIKGLNDGNR